MRDILAHSPDYFSWHGNVRYAAQLAAAIQASLTGLFVTPPGTPIPAPPRLAAEMAAYVHDELQQAVLAGRDFAAWAARWGVAHARWQVALGPASDALAMAGNWHDLIVLQGNASSGDPQERVICDVLLSGTPCIVVPHANVAQGLPVHVMVAWDGSPTSSRALHAALPLLQSAQVVSLSQPAAGSTHAQHTDALSHLCARGVRVGTVETIDGTDEMAGEQLLAYANATRADLIVMGARGCRRLGQRSLGTSTSIVLTQAHLPVFLKN